MTIAAGFKCQGGVVLCADAQETAGDLKLKVEKLVPYDREWCKAGFAGAGIAEPIDMLIEQITEKLDRLQCDSITKIRVAVRSAVVSTYKQFIDDDPTLKDDEKEVDLLIAVKPRAQQEVFLLKAKGHLTTTRPGVEVIGAGDVIRYVAESLYTKNMPINRAVLVGTHLVGLAKKHVAGCGGPTKALIITSDGQMELEPVPDVEVRERFFEQLGEAVRQLTLVLPDLTTDTDAVYEGVDRFAAFCKQLRDDYTLRITHAANQRFMFEHYKGKIYEDSTPAGMYSLTKLYTSLWQYEQEGRIPAGTVPEEWRDRLSKSDEPK